MDIKHYESRTEEILKQNEFIKKELSIYEINLENNSLIFDETKPYNIDFDGVKSDNGYRIIVDFRCSIKTTDGRYSYHNYNFLYRVPQVIESEDRIKKIIEVLKKEYSENKMNFMISNKPFISLLDEEIKKQGK